MTRITIVASFDEAKTISDWCADSFSKFIYEPDMFSRRGNGWNCECSGTYKGKPTWTFHIHHKEWVTLFMLRCGEYITPLDKEFTV